jgi:hypothetical protein
MVTIVRMIFLHFIPAQAIPGYEKMPGIVSKLHCGASSSTFVFWQVLSRRTFVIIPTPCEHRFPFSKLPHSTIENPFT